MLVGPPERQWIAMHPDLVHELVPGEMDGNEDGVGISIEWIGVNWWRKASSPLGRPFGLSLVSVYSDRIEVDNVGHGLMFHLDNRFSLGWTRRGDENGFFLSIDLYRAVMDKKAVF